MNMMRLPLFGLLLAFSLSGCAPGRLVALFPPPADQQLFTAGLEEMKTPGPDSSFDRLRRDYPESPWTERARQVQSLQAERDKQARAAKRQGQELTHLQGRLEQLQRDKGRLQDDLNKLKQLLIDNELRTR